MKKYDYLVFIGRFQPFHKGHQEVVDFALTVSEHVILILGSHNASLDIRNPLTTREREDIIFESINTSIKIVTVNQEDHTYNPDRWVASIQSHVTNIANRGGWSDKPKKIGIIGYDKDHTSYYLKMFPQWELVEYVPQTPDLNATSLRKFVFNNHISRSEKLGFLMEHMCTTEASELFLEYLSRKKELFTDFEVIHKYKADNQRGNYPTIFHTVDAVVVQSGHILLIERGAAPGKGYWAFPGGFLNVHETIEEAVLRELKEETKIDVPIPVLKGSILKRKEFDDPERSVRGRTITTAFYFYLNPNYELPKVTGGDDARRAKWFPLSEFVKMRNVMFEDHYCIAENLIGI